MLRAAKAQHSHSMHHVQTLKFSRIGQLRCSIEIIDANDNAPVFSRSRYTASVSANISIGSHLITVQATDADIGENSRISYDIKKTSAPSNSNFAISQSGVITTTASLLPASTHDVIVVASDHGSPSLSSSAVVTITVLGSTLSSPPLDIIWLVESNSGEIFLKTDKIVKISFTARHLAKFGPKILT